jgi:hypothetical protein
MRPEGVIHWSRFGASEPRPTVNQLRNGAMNKCPACNTRLSSSQDIGGPIGLKCPRCGFIAISGPEAVAGLERLLSPLSNDRVRHHRSRLSHILRRQQRPGGDYAAIPLDELDNWRLDAPLPSAIEQIDSLILRAGDGQPSPGEPTEISIEALPAGLASRLRLTCQTLG